MVLYNFATAFKHVRCARSYRSLRRLSHGDGQMVRATEGRLQPLTTRQALLSWADRILPHAPHCFTYAPTSQHMGMFCPKEEVEQLVEALAEAPFVGWNDCLAFHYIPSYLLSHLQRLAEEKGVKMKSSHLAIVTYQPQLDTKLLRIGPGLRLCRLGMAGLRCVLEETHDTPDMPVAVMRDLAEGVPYLGVYRDAGGTQSTAVDISNLSVAAEEEMPVAWVISCFFGVGATAGTVPDYRRRGLGSILTLAMSRMQADQHGFIPHACIRDHYSASQAMVVKHGCFRHTHDMFSLYGTS